MSSSEQFDLPRWQPMHSSYNTDEYPLSRSVSMQHRAYKQPESPVYSMPIDATPPPPPPPPRRPSGFRRVRGPHDLHPRLDAAAASPVYLSPLHQLTTHILDTYRICNPQFRYESAHNPRRVLTKPSKPAHNDGFDNDDYDYILYVNDWLGTEQGHKYLILDILGQGTFGQVVKCQNIKTHEIVAVKVVKNKPAYFNQSMMEVTILELLNKQADPNDSHHILRLRDSFIHRSHLCLVFELLSSNLYELIKQNQFQGLSTQLVKVFMAQLLDALTVLKEARLIHCDLKPENILLKSLQSPQIKVIDFGSACHERQTVYTYIQSRFYRSPEVLLGLSYTAAIDMWSLGCIAVELFLGLPLFPGTSEYNQVCRIVDMLGMPPASMLNIGKQTSQFFTSYDVWNPHTGQNEKKWRLKSIEQYSRDHNTNEQPGKQYFKANSLPEIINTAPMPTNKPATNGSAARQQHEIEKEMNNRASFIDFCSGLLDMNPVTRWTPQQARLHPFITGEKWVRPFVPDQLTPGQQAAAVTGVGIVSSSSPSATPADSKHHLGGLVPSQPKGTRAYQDAAAYNQQLAQHQVYTAQAQAQQQQQREMRNPYLAPQQQQQQQTSGYTQQPPQPPSDGYSSLTQPPPSVHHRLLHQNSTGQLNLNSSSSMPQFATASGSSSSSYYPNPTVVNQASSSSSSSSRARANTINQMDAVPPALARLQHMNQDVIAGRNALTPVLNRDDAMREWERRQSGKGHQGPVQTYPQLEYLQQQAELAAAGGGWGSGGGGGPSSGLPTARYHHHHGHPAPPSKLSHSYNPNVPPIMVDDVENGTPTGGGGASRRDAVMSNVRTAARGDGGTATMYGGVGSGVISSPPQAYTSNSTTSGNRYALTYNGPPPATSSSQAVPSVLQSHPSQQLHAQQQQQQPSPTINSPFDSRTDIGNMFVPMQTDSGSYGHNSSSTAMAAAAAAAVRHIAPPAQTVAPSFYGAGVAGVLPSMGSGSMPGAMPVPQPSGSGRNPYSMTPPALKDARRTSGMDIWPR